MRLRAPTETEQRGFDIATSSTEPARPSINSLLNFLPLIRVKHLVSYFELSNLISRSSAARAERNENDQEAFTAVYFVGGHHLRRKYERGDYLWMAAACGDLK